jgi:hypothetical protein
MKAKVIISFRDKETQKVHKAGDIIDVPPARFNEITRKGRYIEAYEEPVKKAESKK